MSRRVAATVALFIASWITLPWFIVGLFVSGVIPGGWRTLLVLLALALAAVVVRTLGFLGRGASGANVRRFVFVPLYYVFLFQPLVAMATVAGALVGWPFVGPLAGGRFGTVAALAFLVVFSIAGWFGSRRLVVRHVEVVHPRLAAALDGLRVVQLSDLHVGPQTSRAFLRRIANEVERAGPDIIAFTGDQVDDFPGDAGAFGQAFGTLEAPLGVFAIAGNHDIYAGWDAVSAGLRALDIRVLVNEGTLLSRDGAQLWVGGTGDPAARQATAGHGSPAPDVARTMASAPDDVFRLVLAHNPSLWNELRTRGADLTLSGHTHHGQFSIPRLGWSLASPFVEFAMGRFESGASVLYVSPGTNYWGIPLRLGAWPEVTVVTLRHTGTPAGD